MKSILKLFVLALLFVGVFSCKDNTRTPKPDPKPTPTPGIQEPTEVAQFIWNGLDFWYLWEEHVAPLQLTKGTDELKKFLNEKTSNTDEVKAYNTLFESLLYRKPNTEGRATLDKWSWFIEDYVKQEEAFSGVTKSFGYQYRLFYLDKSKGTVMGVVLYVVPGGPAAKAGIKRGFLFNKINGEELTVNNYKALLYGKDSYSLRVYFPEIKTLSVTAVEKFEENPILKTKVFENIGGKKVGYLVYNGFTGTNKFNLALNDSIGKLKSAGVEEMVLDLRYNGGGSVYTSMLLGSMLDGKHSGQVFAQREYNRIVQPEMIKEYGEEDLKSRFPTNILDITVNENKILAPINSLGLNRLYVLVSDDTASASEMIINGLKPYMDVILIGRKTHGKYVASITLYDMISVDGKRARNPKHKYAMQPIVMKIANANGETDFVDGFAPKYNRNEFREPQKIKPLGDSEELYLKAALALIAGEEVSEDIGIATRSTLENKTLFNSLDVKPLAKQMYDDRMSRAIQK